MANRREITSLTGHASFVFSVVFSADGKILASGHGDHTIKLWDVARWQEIASLSGDSSLVRTVLARMVKPWHLAVRITLSRFGG